MYSAAPWNRQGGADPYWSDARVEGQRSRQAKKWGGLGRPAKSWVVGNYS